MKFFLTALSVTAMTLAICGLSVSVLFTLKTYPLNVIALFSIATVALAGRMILSEAVTGKILRTSSRSAHQAKSTKRHSGWQFDFRPEHQDEYIDFCVRTFLQRNDVRSLEKLSSAVADPGGLVPRISEHIEFSRATLKVVTSRVFKNALIDGTPTLLPVLRANKGELVDRMSLTLDSKAISSLSFVEAQGAALSVLQLLYQRVFGTADVAEWKNDVLLARCLEACISPIPCTFTTSDALLSDVNREAGKLPSVNLLDLNAFTAVLRFCARHYFVFVSLPANVVNGRVTVQHYIIQRDMVAKFSDRLRLSLGLEVREFRIQLPAAVEAASYHATISAPDNLYVYEASLFPQSVPSDSLQLDARRPKFDTPTARTSDTHGLDFVHVYTRDLEGHLSELAEHHPLVDGRRRARFIALSLDLKFRERPPGILLVTTVLAIFLSSLTIAIGHFHDDVFRDLSGESDIGRGGVTLLFAIPALLAGWLITRVDDGVLRRISMSTLFLTTWFILNAGLEVLVGGLKGIQKRDTEADLGLVHLDHIGWSLLTFSCVLNSVLCIYSMLSRGMRYSRRLRKGRNSLTLAQKGAK